MTDYKRTDEKFEFSHRMARVKADIMPRLLPQSAREDTVCNLCEPGGRNPFLDAFL